MQTTDSRRNIFIGSNLKLKHLGWTVLFLAALGVFIVVDLPLLNPHHPARPYYSIVKWVLLPHIVFGVFALIAGPIQFSTSIRQSYPKVHRLLGRGYVVAIVIAAPMGILIPLVGPKAPFFTAGVIVHGSVWFFTTLMAFQTARNRHILQHKQWMLRSYILTFSFVLTRLLAPVWGFFKLDLNQYGMVDVTLNVLYLLVADVVINFQQIIKPKIPR